MKETLEHQKEGHQNHSGHSHNHSHNHGHSHHHGRNSEKSIAIAAVLTGGFMLAEIAGGLISGSLALIADAGHMLTDFLALMLAWVGFWLAKRPATWRSSYGFDRFSVLAAFVNGIFLFLIAGWICYEAIRRFSAPVDVLGGTMFWVALGGLLVNLICFWLLTQGEKDNLNIRAALLHVLGDLLGSVAAIIASLVIIYTGWMPIDPLLSVFVALIILRSAWYIVAESAHILLEGAPPGLDSREVIKTLESEISAINRVHHLHAWSITPERPMLTLEVDVPNHANINQIKKDVKTILKERFGIEHSTVEMNLPDDIPKILEGAGRRQANESP